jgi:hypothetical protein
MFVTWYVNMSADLMYKEGLSTVLQHLNHRGKNKFIGVVIVVGGVCDLRVK